MGILLQNISNYTQKVIVCINLQKMFFNVSKFNFFFYFFVSKNPAKPLAGKPFNILLFFLIHLIKEDKPQRRKGFSVLVISYRPKIVDDHLECDIDFMKLK